MNYSRTVQAGFVCSLAAIVILIAMAIVGSSVAKAFGSIDQPNLPETYAALLRPGAERTDSLTDFIKRVHARPLNVSRETNAP